MNLAMLSVVIIGRNEGARLERCIASVQAMDRQGFSLEIIYVDSASVDSSVVLAESMGATCIPLRQTRTTAALGRNAGWRASSGSIILFLDGDTILDPHFVVRALPSFDSPEIAVAWGHRRETDGAASLYNRVLDLDWMYAPGLTPFCGGDALMRRSVLEATGGFDDTLIAGEEPELCRRITGLGFHVLHIDEPMTGHDLAITHFGQYWRRASRAGHAFAEVSERFRHTASPFWLGEAQRNRSRAILLLVLGLGSLAGALLCQHWWPLLTGLGLFCLVAVRTAWKARWKSGDRLTLLLYGFHSHLQQLPIFVGQLQFRRDRRRGLQRGLVEYKRF